METLQPPAQPPQTAWKFIDELKSPLHKKTTWERTSVRKGEASLAGGVRLDFRFPDEAGVLETAGADFKRFLQAGSIPLRGDFRIATERKPVGRFEAYEIDTDENACRIAAGDSEGIRRALIFVEDEILSSGGPFLKKGKVFREPFIKTRISRCFFGPIKRPPMNRDELADTADYYPDEYLNRLAHEGINGLWLTVQFSDLCPSRFFPAHGSDSPRRLEKLRTTVAKCARYGIKIYVFCIEPRGFGNIPEYLLPEEELEKHDYFRGHREAGFTYFCTSSQEGLAYLEECTHHLFSSVPGLGGLIDINLGERPTHCYSSNASFFGNNCPRCAKRKPWEVFRDTTTTLAAGMHRANPAAEMISWLYVPAIHGSDAEEIEKTAAVIAQIAAHLPGEVIFQYNFESNGRAVQLGRERVLLDYWLAWPGPSRIFADAARAAVRHGSRVSAKIQVGCSHEAATAPFLPVPGNLHKKYSAMHALGVSAVMQCWYFGNYPGIMNKAAGELSFEPFLGDEDAFLRRLAGPEWGSHGRKVVRAWKHFQEGYSNFPYNLSFTWYGAVHDSVVWPLYLFPVDRPISPSWKFTFPLVCGDRIGECLCYDHTLEEALVLLERMSKSWSKGVKLLEQLEGPYAHNRERRLDIGLARALGIQFRSAYNVFRFYALREELPLASASSSLQSLARMAAIACEERENSLALRKLCLTDSRLGFHSEAEGYRYFPQKLVWRAELLEQVLQNDFPAVKSQLLAGEPLFAAYTGTAPTGKGYTCGRERATAGWETFEDGQSQWRSWYSEESLCFEVAVPAVGEVAGDRVAIELEPRRLWPVQKFSVTREGQKHHHSLKVTPDPRWSATTREEGGVWIACFVLPLALFEGFHRPPRPLRLNVVHREAWIPKNPWPGRLRLGTDNPEDLGWLFLEAGQEA